MALIFRIREGFAVLLCLLFITVVLSSEHKHNRIKRKVMFRKNSKFFFRLNGKENIFNYTDIFTHGWGFRINYDLPEDIPKRYKFFKRDVNAEVENLSDESNKQAVSCLMKYVCNMISVLQLSESCGFFCELGNIISESESTEASFFKGFKKKCDYYANVCSQDEFG